jgi:uncharacterized protein YcaQ
MSNDRRLAALEQRLNPDPGAVTFGHCEAPSELSPEDHLTWHRDRAEHCFTLDLGAADVRNLE